MGSRIAGIGEHRSTGSQEGQGEKLHLYISGTTD
jgi:hypothetical protein